MSTKAPKSASGVLRSILVKRLAGVVQVLKDGELFCSLVPFVTITGIPLVMTQGEQHPQGKFTIIGDCDVVFEFVTGEDYVFPFDQSIHRPVFGGGI